MEHVVDAGKPERRNGMAVCHADSGTNNCCVALASGDHCPLTTAVVESGAKVYPQLSLLVYLTTTPK